MSLDLFVEWRPYYAASLYYNNLYCCNMAARTKGGRLIKETCSFVIYYILRCIFISIYVHADVLR